MAQNATNYSNRQLSDAKRAWSLIHALGFPSETDVINLLRLGTINNCPVTVSDVQNATHIFGPSIPSIKGKTTRNVPDRVRTDIVAVPAEVLNVHRYVTLGMDILKINKLDFLITTSTNIAFTTIGHLSSTNMTDVLVTLKSVVKLYTGRGIKVIEINADNAFESLRLDLAEIMIHLNTAASEEHVPLPERRI